MTSDTVPRTNDLAAPASSTTSIELLFEGLHDACFFTCDAEGRLARVNDAFAKRVCRSSPSEVSGRHAHEFFAAHSCDESDEEPGAWYAPRPTRDQVVLLSRRDGSRDWFSITKLPLVDDTGVIAGLCGVMRLLSQPAAPEIASSPWARVIDVMLTSYGEHLPISALAARASLSVSQFNRQFRKRFDTTPHRYLAGVRVNAACYLLISTDLSIAEIALRTGFCDQSHLTNQFVRLRGVTPAKYRARYCKTVSLVPPLPPPPLRSAS